MIANTTHAPAGTVFDTAADAATDSGSTSAAPRT